MAKAHHTEAKQELPDYILRDAFKWEVKPTLRDRN